MAEKTVKQQGRYLSYLLRLWQESGPSQEGDAPLWRASLERPQSDVREAFASLADLFAFLESETGTRSVGLDCSESEGQ
jgi:hypothetical protein